MAPHSSILAWRIPMDRGARWAKTHRVAKSWIQRSEHTPCCVGFRCIAKLFSYAYTRANSLLDSFLVSVITEY